MLNNQHERVRNCKTCVYVAKIIMSVLLTSSMSIVILFVYTCIYIYYINRYILSGVNFKLYTQEITFLR